MSPSPKNFKGYPIRGAMGVHLLLGEPTVLVIRGWDDEKVSNSDRLILPPMHFYSPDTI